MEKFQENNDDWKRHQCLPSKSYPYSRTSLENRGKKSEKGLALWAGIQKTCQFCGLAYKRLAAPKGLISPLSTYQGYINTLICEQIILSIPHRGSIKHCQPRGCHKQRIYSSTANEFIRCLNMAIYSYALYPPSGLNCPVRTIYII